MTFKEQFPELQDCRIKEVQGPPNIIGAGKRVHYIPEWAQILHSEENIEKFCLSKSKVKESIEKLFGECQMPEGYKYQFGCNCENHHNQNKILKELGLNDEETHL